jgi:hypothetical protein
MLYPFSEGAAAFAGDEGGSEGGGQLRARAVFLNLKKKKKKKL